MSPDWSQPLMSELNMIRVTYFTGRSTACVCVLPTGRSFLIVPDLRRTSWPLSNGCHPSLYLAFPLEVSQVASFLSFSLLYRRVWQSQTMSSVEKRNSSPVFARPLSSRSTIRFFTIDYSGWQSLKLAKILFFGQRLKRLKAFVSSSFRLETRAKLCIIQ